MSKPIESCYHCQLPIPNKSISRRNRFYCCYGCVLAHQITGEKGEEGEALWILLRLGLSAFFAMNVVLLSLADYVYPFDGEISPIINYIKLILTAPVLALLGPPMLRNSVSGILSFTFNLDLFIVIGTFSAFILSVYYTVQGSSDVYFDTASMLLVLVTLGRLLEANAKSQTSNAIRELLEISPKVATIVGTGSEQKVPIQSVRIGDTVKVLPGETIPVDGEVVDGQGSVDESMLTGESKYAFKEKGSEVMSGTMNMDGLLIFRATHVGEEMVLSRFINLLRGSRGLRAPVERLADKISSIFVPVAIVISVLTFVFWLSKSGVNVALMNSLSVLLISCPCALGLATPMAIWVALGRAARKGILIRTGEALEKVSSVKRIFFDKTGTITKRDLKLTSIFIDPGVNFPESDVIAISASLESLYDHPLGRSLVQEASRRSYSLFPVTDFRAIPGMGVQGNVNGELIHLGSHRFMVKGRLKLSKAILDQRNKLESEGKTIMFIGINRDVIGIFAFTEVLKEKTMNVFEDLGMLGINNVVLTGDNRFVSNLLSKAINVEIKSELYPQDKVQEISNYNGKRELTAMVGDGINDAPALSAADVGIAVGCGADITRESADVSLLSDDLTQIPWVIRLARKTRRIIKENLFWAFIYNFFGIGFAVVGILQPVIAAIAMILSSLLVLGNSLRLQNLKIESLEVKKPISLTAQELQQSTIE